MSKIRTVVIDDEFFNRGLITMLINKFDAEFDIAGEAESVNEGYKIITKLAPDVVFLDIKMPDGSGFDLLKKFDVINFDVVFITGFDKYALQAFEHNVLEYVLKPVDLDKFKQTLERVNKRFQQKAQHSPGEFITRIPLQYDEKVIVLSVNEIQYVISDGVSTRFFKDQNETFASSKPLSEFRLLLSGASNFIQVSETTYANIKFVTGYSNGANSSIKMADGKIITLSENRQEAVFTLLGQRKINAL